MINEQGIAVNTPDLSRLYIISGRMMFDDEEEVMLLKPTPPVKQKRHSGDISPTERHTLKRHLSFRRRPFNHCYQTGSLFPP